MKKFKALLAFFLLGACTQSSLFSPIGTNFSAPIAVAVDPANSRAYVVNSNTHQKYIGSTLSILNITNPVAPTLLNASQNPISVPDFSGQIYFDAATRRIFLPNRLSDNTEDKVDALLRIQLDETAAATFGTVDSFTSGDNPFGIACCDSSNRFYVVSSGGTLNVYDPSSLSNPVSLSLSIQSASGLFLGSTSNEVTFLTNQAFITNQNSYLFVINTTEIGDTSKNPIDYILINAGVPRGIATNGGLLYVVDGSSSSPVLRIINPASLTAINPDSSAPTEVDITTIQTTSVALGTDPNEIVIFNGRAYVSNRGSNTISVIDLTSNTLVTTISVGSEPFGLTAFTLNNDNFLYVTNLISNSLSIVNLATNTVVGTFAP